MNIIYDKHIDWRVELPNLNIRRVIRPYHFNISGLDIIVKEGFYFDGASRPRLLWTLSGSPFTGKTVIASILHDVLYAAALLPRKVCDDIYRQISIECDASAFTQYTDYQGLRLFGASRYQTDPKVISAVKEHLIISGSYDD